MTYTDGKDTVTVAKRNTKFGVRYHLTGKWMGDAGKWLDEHTLGKWVTHWEAEGLYRAS